MKFLLDGVYLGGILALLAGPILFALIQTGIERGIRLGTVMGLGVWISDLLFILGVYFGTKNLSGLENNPQFKLYLGIIGGIVLLGFGLFTLLTLPKFDQNQKITVSTYSGYFFQGFLINTINPFTIIFWISVTSTEIIATNATESQAVLFYTGVLGTIILTDLLKVGLAKKISPYLKPHYLVRLRKGVGLGLIAFGIALIVRVVVAF